MLDWICHVFYSVAFFVCYCTFFDHFFFVGISTTQRWTISNRTFFGFSFVTKRCFRSKNEHWVISKLVWWLMRTSRSIFNMKQNVWSSQNIVEWRANISPGFYFSEIKYLVDPHVKQWNEWETHRNDRLSITKCLNVRSSLWILTADYFSDTKIFRT